MQDNPNLYPEEFILIGKCLKLEDLNLSNQLVI
jgi:hypothetical protein